MTVRTIKTCHRSVRGLYPGIGHYESTLERDYFEILSFDEAVTKVTPQPLRIDFVDPDGRNRSYTPDGLVHFDPNKTSDPRPLLYEIKYREDLRLDRKVLFYKFRAAKNYALERMWRFEVFTERSIRTSYLSNVRFLKRYLALTPDPIYEERILSLLEDLREAPVSMLLLAVGNSENERATALTYIWSLVARRSIGCDLDAPLSMKSVLWREICD